MWSQKNDGQVEPEWGGQVEAELPGQVEADWPGQVKRICLVKSSGKMVVKLNGLSIQPQA